MQDDVQLTDGYQFDMLTRIEYGVAKTQVSATNDITATIVAPDSDYPNLTFIAEIVDPPADIFQS